VTGLRTSEACGLDRTDVDLHQAVLTIRDTKFGKSRQVPVHSSTIAALDQYARERNQEHPAPRTPAFFLSTRGTRLDAHNLPHTFARLITGTVWPPGEMRATDGG
jgi:integrase